MLGPLDAERLLGQQAHDPQPRFVGQGFEEGQHLAGGGGGLFVHVCLRVTNCVSIELIVSKREDLSRGVD
jgi:hypothetical protein